ncbi:hypothetical protein HLH36_01510 [Gluconacetobacter aggeris]|uniref:Lectin-like protein BA14k n=1 Tax=Gluconacetobacter aggeris TaxID=1286186 RepID=A0A7W4IQD8_9PROT|nr:BA14K family protein [Gluconacetobacter aggeris]MBB2167043.1 hypothetical protein [Gluconacetobacter aggeris]
MNERPRSSFTRLTGLSALCAMALLAGCAKPPAPVAPKPVRHPPLQFAPGTAVEAPPPANEAQLVNDPSAPLDTPLCGAAAHTTQGMAARLNPAPLVSGNACTANACFDPLTGTYIGADGERHICR